MCVIVSVLNEFSMCVFACAHECVHAFLLCLHVWMVVACVVYYVCKWLYFMCMCVYAWLCMRAYDV